MNLQKICLSILIFVSSLAVCFGQDKPETVEGQTWVNEYDIYQDVRMTFRYDRYSKEDTVKFREKLDLLKAAKFADEWEGAYYSGFPDEVGVSSFRWDANAGFVEYYVYSCFPELRYLNYGKITNTPEFIQTIPEFAADSPRKEKAVKYIKVKWSNRHYLVEESSLLAFAERAAGIYVEPEDDSSEDRYKWSNHWVKGDLEQELTGLPEFPASYKRFQRQPIETKITSVGKRTIEKEVQTARWFTPEENAVYQVTVEAGAKKGVKRGMIFEVPETGDAILITQVNQNYAIGIIGRDINENKNDNCLDRNFNQIVCRKIKSSLKVKTETGKLWF
jgi:hypothetical protein